MSIYNRGKGQQRKIPRRKKSTKNLFDESKEINVAVKTGDVLLGEKSVLSEMSMGSLKLIVLAKNTPRELKNKVKMFNNCLEEPIPIYTSRNSSWDLGAICGKPFWISALGVLNVGDSSIMEAI